MPTDRSAGLEGLGPALGVVLPLVALFMRDRPAEIGLVPFGATEPDPLPAAAGNPFASAIDGLRMARTSSGSSSTCHI